MAATTSFTSLAPPAHDDTMDMSSPARRPYDDDDIEIDFDEYPAPVEAADEDRMLEDESTRPATAADEVMDEDVQITADAEQVPEEVMHYDELQPQEATAIEDEELIDYSDDEELQDPAADGAEIPNVTEAPQMILEIVEEGADEEIQVPDDEIDFDEHQQPSALTEALGGEAAHDSDTATEMLPAEVSTVEADPEADHEVHLPAELVEEPIDFSHYQPDEHEIGAEEDTHPPITIDTTLDAPADGPVTPTDTGLHPMILTFGDLTLPLFKSRKQLDGLLKDDNLANVSLADLMSSCRARLPLKTDEIITDDHDLVLSFDQLALMLVEVSNHPSSAHRHTANSISQDSRAAASTSLNEVLQVYLQLHHNDGVEEVEPLSLTLSTQLRFSSSLTMFRQAIASGQGMSSFDFSHGLGDAKTDHEQYVQDGEDWTGLATKDFEDGDNHSFEDGTYAGENGDREDPNAGQDVEGVGHDEQYQDADQQYYFDENAQGEYDAEYQGEAADALEGLASHSTADQHDVTDGEHPILDTEADAGLQDGNEQQEEAPEKPITSATATADRNAATITTGEYDDDDIIDWDEDDLTTDNSDNTDKAQNEESTEGTMYDQGEEDQQDPSATEDWLQEYPDQDQEQQAGNDDETHQEGAYDDYTNIDFSAQHEFDEAADQSGQREEGHEGQQDHQPGEGEQIHAADAGLEAGGDEYIDFQGDTAEQPVGEEEFDDTVLIHRQDDESYEDLYQEGDPQAPEQSQAKVDDLYDEIDFGEDDDAEAQSAEAITAPAAPGVSNGASNGSPLGKRSFSTLR